MISLPVPALGLSVAGSIVDVTRTVLGRTRETAEFALSIPARVESLLGEAESLIDSVESLIRRIDSVVTDATDIVEGASV
ncbi:MAG: ribulose 1,5-bisphosphate carboxylase large subunit, partial [Rhodococcus sp. (in: high G+C Gram-positive bacteria)]